MTERGIIVSYESIHQWCLKFGDEYALKLRKRRGQPGDKWHLEEIFIKINGKTHYPMKDEELVSFFGQTTFARLGTLNGDGTN